MSTPSGNWSDGDCDAGDTADFSVRTARASRDSIKRPESRTAVRKAWVDSGLSAGRALSKISLAAWRTGSGVSGLLTMVSRLAIIGERPDCRGAAWAVADRTAAFRRSRVVSGVCSTRSASVGGVGVGAVPEEPLVPARAAPLPSPTKAPTMATLSAIAAVASVSKARARVAGSAPTDGAAGMGETGAIGSIAKT